MVADPNKKRHILLHLAAEAVVPVLGGCAGALAAGPAGGLAGVALGRAVEKAVDLFGEGIVDRWQAWLAAQPAAEAGQAVSELVNLTHAEAREEARIVLLELAPEADAHDLDLAVEYLSALPRAVDRALVPDPDGGRSIPMTLSLADPRQLLLLLPEDVPPYPTGAGLPNTPYRLVELVGTGGFGAVYRAVSPTLQHLPLAIKFCLDRNLVPALNQERSNLERLMRAGGSGSAHVARLYGYDLDHETPFLVYEYIAGGDLTGHLAARCAALGRPPGADEVLGWIVQIADGLAFAHRTGLVHRDLKPANVLVDGHQLKLADFGLGGVAVRRAVLMSRIRTSTREYLSLAEQASLFRGAGTPLYMSPEQRGGADPDPRHDLYALGVVWFQLLVGDVSRELPPGWAKELRVRHGVPADHIDLLERCVGWYDDRPKDAGELLPLLREASGGRQPPEDEPVPDALGGLTPPARQAETVTSASAITPSTLPEPRQTLLPLVVGLDRLIGRPSTLPGPRQTLLLVLTNRLRAAHAELDRYRKWSPGYTVAWGLLFGLLVGWLVGEVSYKAWYNPDGFPNAFVGPKFDIWFVLIGAAVGLAVWGVYVYVLRLGLNAAAADVRKRVIAAVDELAAELPAEVAGWGGTLVLRDPEAFARICDELTAATTPPSATSTLAPGDLAADPTTKAVLAARLREQARILNDSEDHIVFAWLGQIGLSVAAGSAVGGLMGYAFNKLRFSEEVSTTLGVLAGVIAIALIWIAMAHVRRLIRRQRDTQTAQLAADYPRLVESWGGKRVLMSKETVDALLKSFEPEQAGRHLGWLRRMFGG